ncbi:DUF2785 domain-containing protein [Thalassobacillus hwangdonensis]|uniref:DUF2785 domain-containing protein n=1 Tax=Thalassobacillus hwangdonensis TaxID=546108 RepID=A0ABW3KZT0_9BACI
MEERIIERLRKVKADDYQLGEIHNLQDLTTLMLQKIGSTDPVLRDELIYTTFSTFIMKEYYSNEQMKSILKSVLNKNYLFYRIGHSHKEEDAVFKRSFSVLLIPPIFHQHQQEAFLTEKEIHDTWEALKKYIQQEKDHRGYVEGKGWAHAMAHAADALAAVAKCEEIHGEALKSMLPVIQQQFLIDQPYLHDEEERMVTAIMVMFGKMEHTDKVAWLESLIYQRKTWTDPNEDIIINNSKHLLRALYFRMLYGDHRPMTQVIENLLRELRKEEAY